MNFIVFDWLWINAVKLIAIPKDHEVIFFFTHQLKNKEPVLILTCILVFIFYNIDRIRVEQYLVVKIHKLFNLRSEIISLCLLTMGTEICK